MNDRISAEQYRKHRDYIHRTGRVPDNPAIRTTDTEPGSGGGVERSVEVEKVHPPLRCIVHTFRVRPADSDNVFAKWANDAAVEQIEAIKDDGKKYIIETVYRETIVRHRADEKTIITFVIVSDTSEYKYTAKGWSYEGTESKNETQQ